MRLGDRLLGGLHLEVEGTGGSEAFVPGLVYGKDRYKWKHCAAAGNKVSACRVG